jgi:hypothetical protein
VEKTSTTEAAWQQRLAKKQAELEAAQAELTETDKVELQARDQEAELDVKIREARQIKRGLLLARSVEAWREKLGAGGKRVYVDGVEIEGRDDWFVIAASKGAQESLTVRVNHKQTKPNHLPGIYLDYAMLVVKEWNGEDTSSPITGEKAVELRRMLEDNPGVVTTITQAATRLAGAHADDHKS